MISIVIPTYQAARTIGPCLTSLIPATLQGYVKEVIISDGGSADPIEQIADEAGAKFVPAPHGRGAQLAAGAAAARGDWLLFLHADTVLEKNWEIEAARFMAMGNAQAACFKLAFDSDSRGAKIVGGGANIRTRIFKLPYGDQGLLISRDLYDAIGGFDPIPLFEDVRLIRRLVRQKGRGGIKMLDIHAVTSAQKYENQGYVQRVLKNFTCLMMYFAGRPPEDIAKIYK